jgi:protein-S-isoprenylcysteine O-methyltransferase Ste14
MAKDILQHLVSLILPVIALILVPSWIEPHITRGGDAAFTAGAGLMLIGLLIMGHTIASFIRIGKGTLAPWSPTSRLVIEGLYTYVRNPMILGVIIVLLGEALAFGSWRILGWALAFFAINTLYFVRLEEPGLEKRFGEPYRRYRQNVPRWLPRLLPWRAE